MKSYLFLRTRVSFTFCSYSGPLISTKIVQLLRTIHVEVMSYSDISYPSTVCGAL